MAWTYSDWITRTGSQRLTRLRLHIVEVSDALQGAGVTSDQTKYDPTTLQPYLASLIANEKEISAALNADVFCIPTRRREELPRGHTTR